MINVTVLGFDYALGTAITGINDLLCLAGVTWNRIHGKPITPAFKVRIASEEKKPIHCLNQLTLLPHCAIDEVANDGSDIVLVPTIAGNIEQVLNENGALIDALTRFSNSNAVIGSNCTGAFFLAEAGILDNRLATTHWGFANQFTQRYPKVNLNADMLITDDADILCAGGGLAWFDLGLYLIERFCDHETAVGAAKSFVIDMGRSSQLTYSPLSARKYHSDPTVLSIQQWLEEHFDDRFTIDGVAEQFGLSNRSLIRRFKTAIGMPPSNYLQEIRLDAARKRLEQTNLSIEEITHQIGYEDISSFTKLFKRKTGFTPSHYRNRFKKPLQAH